MSRIGRRILEIPEKVEVNVDNKSIFVSVVGPLGKITKKLNGLITIEINERHICTKTPNQKKKSRQMWGTTNSLLKNWIDGVVNGFQKTLFLQGLGFKAKIQEKKLHLNLGFSHPIIFDYPSDIEIEVIKNNEIIIKGIDKEKVGLIASKIRKLCPVEPYKGKGVRYKDEIVRRKVGKTAATKK